MFPAPRTTRLQFQIENDVVAFGEFQSFFECRDAFAGKRATEPGASVEAANLGKREVVYIALAVSSAIDGIVVDSDESRIASEL